MIRKGWEFSCDVCGIGDHFGGVRESAVRHAKLCGWLIKGRETVYCSKECKRKKESKPNDR